MDEPNHREMSGNQSTPTDIVVGCISGLPFGRIAAWAGSLAACGFQGRRIIIYNSIDADTLSELRRRGFELFDASPLHNEGPLAKNPAHDSISVNRFYYIWYFLSRPEIALNARYLVATDVSDVIFQKDPSAWLERNLGRHRIVAGSESLRFKDEPWSAETMREAFGPHVWEAYRERTIYNAGTIAGHLQTMLDLSLQIYFLSPGSRITYSDQQAMNLLLGSGVYREITRFADSEEGWACQGGTVADPNLLKTVRGSLMGPEPKFDGEFVRTAAGDIFTIVHQYDRVPAWRGLAKKYGGMETVPAERKSIWKSLWS